MNKEKMEVEEARNNAHQAASLQSTQGAKKLLTCTAIFLAQCPHPTEKQGLSAWLQLDQPRVQRDQPRTQCHAVRRHSVKDNI